MYKGLFSRILLTAAGITGWLAIALLAPASIAKMALSASFLLLVPGFMLLRVVKPHGAETTGEALAYSVGLSALLLMLTGLSVNAAYLALNIQNPLSPQPLAFAITAVLGIMSAWLFARRGTTWLPAIRRPRLSPTEWLMAGYGAMLPIISAAGAISLNNGGSNWLAITSFGLIAMYVLAMIWPQGPKTGRMFPYGLFMTGLALLLGTSLRGWFITGHDIIQEYQVFELTKQHSAWSMSYLHDAYNACLSITILPTVLARLTGIADPYIYKVVVQGIFALVPVVLYLMLLRFLPRRTAFLSALVFITFPTFLTDMSMLNRQEIAFLFFALFLLTLFNKQLAGRIRSVLLLLLGLGMVFSHYSTSYVGVAIMLAAKVLEIGVTSWTRLRHRAATSEPGANPLSWPMVLALALTVYLWNSQITVTSQGIAKTISGITGSLPKILAGTTQTGVGTYSLVGKALSQDEIFRAYRASVVSTRDQAANAYYDAKITDKYPVQPAKEAVDAPTQLGQALSHQHMPLYSINDGMRSVYAKLVQILILLGLTILICNRRLSRIPRQYKILGVSSLVMIVLQVLLPAVIDYGLLRLIQQSLMFLAPAIVLVCLLGLRLTRISNNWGLRLTALLFAGFFLVNSGFLSAVLGGYKPVLATSSNGFYYEAYYTHADEIAGFQWLAGQSPKGSIINADEFARRKMITYTDGRIYARQSLAPSAIAQDAYVFLSYGDTTFNRVPFYFNGQLLYEQPPTQFLQDTKDKIYDNGQVEVYK